MIKPTIIMGGLILMVLALAVFQVERHVQGLRTELEEVNRQLIADREEIHVLEAEWAYLNQPMRLREVTQAHLELSNINVQQIGSLDTIAYRTIALSSNDRLGY